MHLSTSGQQWPGASETTVHLETAFQGKAGESLRILLPQTISQKMSYVKFAFVTVLLVLHYKIIKCLEVTKLKW